MNSQPPKIFLRFFRWYCHPRLVKPIEGDLMELYQERMQRSGKRRADLLFAKDVLALFRKDIIKPADGTYKLNTYGMLQSYLKVGLRNIFSLKSISSFKVLGLTIGMGCYLIIQTFISYHESFDKFHSNASQTYRIDYELTHKETILSHSATTPPTIAPFVKENIAGVGTFTRIYHYPDLVIRHDRSIFREDRVFIVDPSFFKVFDFHVLEGDPETALSNKGAMMISSSAKKKYFGDSQALGQTISIDGYMDYYITGVFEDPPQNSHLQFDILLSFETARWWFEGTTETDWTSRDYYSYIVLADGTKVDHVLPTLQNINQQSPQGELDQKREVKRVYSLTKLEDIHLHSHLEEEIDASFKGDASLMKQLNIISIVILVIAWFNYINQSTARLFVRSKEVGIRKVMGASHKSLLLQFVTESFLVHAFSLLVAALGIPILYYMIKVDIRAQFLVDVELVSRTLIVLAVGFAVSSFIPALYVLKLDLNKALKDKLVAGLNGQMVRRTMVVLQLVASAVFITASLVIFLQLDHIQNQKKGIDLNKVLVVRGPTTSETDIALFIHKMQENPNIVQVGAGEFVPGFSEVSSAPISRTDLQDLVFEQINTVYVSHGYLNVLNANFIEGRNFDPGLNSDTAALILNKAAIEKLQFESLDEAIGASLKFGSGYLSTVVGVIDNYRQTSAKEAPLPMAFWLYPEESTHILIQFNGSETTVRDSAAALYGSLFPEDPFDYFFLEDFYHQQFDADQKFGQLFFVFTVLAIMISCLGVYSLTYWSTIRRTKEIGIRKVLGAKVDQIVGLLSSELLVLVILTLLIATPIAYFMMKGWLMNYSSRISLTPSIFLYSAGIILGLIVLTVGYRTLKIALTNPVNSLKDE